MTSQVRVDGKRWDQKLGPMRNWDVDGRVEVDLALDQLVVPDEIGSGGWAGSLCIGTFGELVQEGTAPSLPAFGLGVPYGILDKATGDNASTDAVGFVNLAGDTGPSRFGFEIQTPGLYWLTMGTYAQLPCRLILAQGEIDITADVEGADITENTKVRAVTDIHPGYTNLAMYLQVPIVYTGDETYPDAQIVTPLIENMSDYTGLVQMAVGGLRPIAFF